eukprot:Pgem_evm6s8721
MDTEIQTTMGRPTDKEIDNRKLVENNFDTFDTTEEPPKPLKGKRGVKPGTKRGTYRNKNLEKLTKTEKVVSMLSDMIVDGELDEEEGQELANAIMTPSMPEPEPIGPPIEEGNDTGNASRSLMAAQGGGGGGGEDKEDCCEEILVLRTQVDFMMNLLTGSGPYFLEKNKKDEPGEYDYKSHFNLDDVKKKEKLYKDIGNGGEYKKYKNLRKQLEKN